MSDPHKTALLLQATVHAENLLQALRQLSTDEERIEVLSVLTNHVCVSCGNMVSQPCYCRRDD